MINALKTAATVSILTANAAAAATVNITLTEYGDRASAVAAQDAFLSGQNVLAYEDFESFTSFDTVYPNSTNTDPANPDTTLYDYAGPDAGTALSTSVGTFNSLTPTGTGGSNREPDNAAIIRSNADENNNGQPNYGRYDADDGTNVGSNFIDSNDNQGIRLDTKTGAFGSFDALTFILTDFDDVGILNFSLSVLGAGVDPATQTNIVQQGNGDIFVATIQFDDLVSNIFVDMQIDTGDGFGADSFAVLVSPDRFVPIPIPASGFMLLAGMAALGATARRKARTAEKRA